MKFARALVPALVVVLIATATPASARTPVEAARGAQWIANQQQSDGGFFMKDQPADAVADVLSALAAGGVGGEVAARSLSAIAKIGPARAQQRAAYAGRIALGLLAFARDPRRFDGVDYIARIRSFSQPTGEYDTGVYSDAIAVLALAAAGDPVPSQAITYISAQQCAGGGYGHDAGCVHEADVDTTSMTIIALRRAGVGADNAAVGRARTWLADVRNADGGFGYTSGARTNANSTGLALSAIAALRESPTDPAWSAHGADPLKALRALQTDDGGFRYIAGDARANAYATVQAVPGVAGDAYPVPALRISVEVNTTTSPHTKASSARAQPTASLVFVQPTIHGDPSVVPPEPTTASRIDGARPSGARTPVMPRALAGVALGLACVGFGSRIALLRRRSGRSPT
jgi:hypothetical protein